jgi:hypothetical protein
MIGSVYQEGSPQLDEPSLTGHPRSTKSVTLSNTEAEYFALSKCAQEAILTWNLLIELTKIRQTAIIYEDNLGVSHFPDQESTSLSKDKTYRNQTTFSQKLGGRQATRSKICEIRKHLI